jgi:hypothetical protein
MVHGGNVVGDIFTIREAQKRCSRNASICKEKFTKMCGTAYDEIEHLLPRIPEAILDVLNIYRNVTTLDEWNRSRFWNYQSKRKCTIGRKLKDKCLSIRRQLADWVGRRGLDNSALKMMDKICREIISEYNYAR